MTGYVAAFLLGLACAMWIRWDQTQALKDELAAARRQTNSLESRRRWWGIYHHPDTEQEKVR